MVGGRRGQRGSASRSRAIVVSDSVATLLPLGNVGRITGHSISDLGFPTGERPAGLTSNGRRVGRRIAVAKVTGCLSGKGAVITRFIGDGIPRGGTLDGGNGEVNHSAICKSQICIAIRGIICILVKIAGGIKRDGIGERVDIAAAGLLCRIAQLPCKSVFIAAHASGQREVNAGSHRVGNGCTADIDTRGNILSNRCKRFIQSRGVVSIICTARCGNGITQEGANSRAITSKPTAVPA